MTLRDHIPVFTAVLAIVGAVAWMVAPVTWLTTLPSSVVALLAGAGTLIGVWLTAQHTALPPRAAAAAGAVAAPMVVVLGDWSIAGHVERSTWPLLLAASALSAGAALVAATSFRRPYAAITLLGATVQAAVAAVLITLAAAFDSNAFLIILAVLSPVLAVLVNSLLLPRMEHGAILIAQWLVLFTILFARLTRYERLDVLNAALIAVFFAFVIAALSLVGVSLAGLVRRIAGGEPRNADALPQARLLD